jgi:hypothetical protein
MILLSIVAGHRVLNVAGLCCGIHSAMSTEIMEPVEELKVASTDVSVKSSINVLNRNYGSEFTINLCRVSYLYNMTFIISALGVRVVEVDETDGECNSSYVKMVDVFLRSLVFRKCYARNVLNH